MDLLEIFRDSKDLVQFSAGEVIMAEGEPGELMYVVMEGEVRITLKGKVLATASSGEIVGEMSLINSGLRSATVTASTDCVLAMIDGVSFQSMLRHVPDFALHIVDVLGKRLQTAFDMIEHDDG